MKYLIIGLALLVQPAELVWAEESLAFHAEKSVADAFDETGLKILGVGALATALALTQDQAMQAAWVNNQRMDPSVSVIGDYWGRGYVEFGAVAAQLIFDRKNGVPALEGTLTSTVATYALKYGVQRQRPSNGNRDSFPSGHTQAAFAMATTLHMSYGFWPAAPIYFMAVFTGLSRMADNAHWFSDVVAGATVGVLFGRAGFKHHFAVTPMAFESGDRGFGLVVNLNY